MLDSRQEITFDHHNYKAQGTAPMEDEKEAIILQVAKMSGFSVEFVKSCVDKVTVDVEGFDGYGQMHGGFQRTITISVPETPRAEMLAMLTESPQHRPAKVYKQKPWLRLQDDHENKKIHKKNRSSLKCKPYA